MQFIKSLMSLAMIAAVVYVGITVPLGDKSLFGHFRAIWSSDETQELVDGVRETGGPMLDKLDRAVSAGLEEARRQAGDGAESDVVDDDGAASDGHDAERDSDVANEAEPSGIAPGSDGDSAAVPPGANRAKSAGAAVARTDGPAARSGGDDRGSADFEIRPKIDIHVAP